MNARGWVLIASLIGCAGGGGTLPTESPTPDGTEPSAPTPEEVGGGGSSVDDAGNCADLFASDHLPAFEVTISEGDWVGAEWS